MRKKYRKKTFDENNEFDYDIHEWIEFNKSLIYLQYAIDIEVETKEHNKLLDNVVII